MSLDATRWAWVQKIKPTMKLILLSLADRADEKNCCYPSIERLENDTCLNRKTIISGIKQLSELCIISIKRSHGKSNFYQLNGVQNRVESSPKKGTSPKNGTGVVPKTAPQVVVKTVPESTNESINNLPSDLDAELFNDFLDSRKKLKALNTDRAMKILFGEIDKIRALGQDPNKAIETAILKGWKTVYPVSTKKVEISSYGEGGI